MAGRSNEYSSVILCLPYPRIFQNMVNGTHHHFTKWEKIGGSRGCSVYDVIQNGRHLGRHFGFYSDNGDSNAGI